MTTQALWHASDDPNIEIFHPHRAPTAQIDDDLVWAIDEAHVPAYWFPRFCPRATFWIGPNTNTADIAWMNGPSRVHAIEWGWWERFRTGRIHLYLMPPATFTVHNAEAGYYVSRGSVTPLARVDIDDLLHEHQQAGVELRVVNDLWPLWGRVDARIQSHPPEERAPAGWALSFVRAPAALGVVDASRLYGLSVWMITPPGLSNRFS